jgi:hypothetical protein
MIVRSDGDRLLLITQPAHAELAGRIMQDCAPLADHPRRASILLACAEHDGGWITVDAHPGVDLSTGQIVDFMTAPALTKQTVWPRAVARLSADPWAAALVAHHAITVYSRYRDDEAWRSFFPDLTALRDEQIRAAGRSLADIDTDYPFVRLADLISLTFCNRWDEPQAFGDWTVRRDGDHTIVSPDAFGGRTVAFEILAASVPRQRFSSSAQLHDALQSASIVTLTGSVGFPT